VEDENLAWPQSRSIVCDGPATGAGGRTIGPSSRGPGKASANVFNDYHNYCEVLRILSALYSFALNHKRTRRMVRRL